MQGTLVSSPWSCWARAWWLGEGLVAGPVQEFVSPSHSPPSGPLPQCLTSGPAMSLCFFQNREGSAQLTHHLLLQPEFPSYLVLQRPACWGGRGLAPACVGWAWPGAQSRVST